MKRKILLIVLMILSGVCMGNPRIISSEPCEYRDVSCERYGYQKWFKDEVSYNQALEDLDMLRYLLKTAYVGYEDALNRGMQIDQMIESFCKMFSENANPLRVSDISKFICDYLKLYIQDCHFRVEAKDFAKSLVSQKRVLYSKVYVKKINDAFYVEKSDYKDIKIGEPFECESKNLFLYPSEGDGIYRVGSFATLDENEKTILAKNSGKDVDILCNVANNYFSSNNITSYKEIETKDSLYIYIPTFIDLESNDNRRRIMDENYEKLQSVSERYPEKKNIILDLRTNGGGNSRHSSKFLANLFFLEKHCDEKRSSKNIEKMWRLIGCDGSKIDLISPSIQQAEQWLSKYVFLQEKYWITEINKRKKILNNRNLRITYSDQKIVKPKSGESKFKGKLIILSGKNTCSSSELAIFEAKSVFSKTNQFFHIGENSAGCYAYGNVWCYQLVNTGIALHLSSFKTPFSDKCPEGLGFIPDYWSTNDDILKAIVNITNDIELLKKLEDINNNL